jgi:GNAT superfamily N-acetyltransferase
MSAPCTLVERFPTVEEYVRLIAAVGFRPRRREAIALALQHSWFSVCAEAAGEAVGMGRVIGDGGLHLYLTDVIVHPAHQRRGVGTAIVAALTAWVDAAPFPNTDEVGQHAKGGVTGSHAGNGQLVTLARNITAAVALCFLCVQTCRKPCGHPVFRWSPLRSSASLRNTALM